MAQTFGAAFKAARAAKGPGKTFTWNGKSYSTDLKEETLAGKKPKKRPAAMTAQSGAAQSGTAGKVKPKPAPAFERTGRSTAPAPMKPAKVKQTMNYLNLAAKVQRDKRRVKPAS